MAYSDDFAGTGALSGNWTVDNAAVARATDLASATGVNAYVRYTGGTFADDQYAEGTVVFNSGAVHDCGVMVRAKVFAGSGNLCYYLYAPGDLNANLIRLGYFDGFSGPQDLQTYAVTVADGDVLRLEVSGDNLTGYRNGSALGTAVAGGGRRSSGLAGLMSPSNGFALWNLWSGGDLGVTLAVDDAGWQPILRGSPYQETRQW